MGHDDFPEEDTDPGVGAHPVQPGHFAPQTSGHAPVQPYGQQAPQHHQPQQQHQHQPQQHQQQPLHPQHHQQHAQPQQQWGEDPSGMMRPPQTGGYSQVGNQTGGHHTAPQHNSTAFPVQNAAPVPMLQAPLVQPAEEKASRVIYGLSGMAFGGIMGVILGVINTFAEGLTITQGSEFIMQGALWCAFLVGGLAFWKPDRFDHALDRLQDKFGGEDDDPDRTMD